MAINPEKWTTIRCKTFFKLFILRSQIAPKKLILVLITKCRGHQLTTSSRSDLMQGDGTEPILNKLFVRAPHEILKQEPSSLLSKMITDRAGVLIKKF
jgi:hypothetical protein